MKRLARPIAAVAVALLLVAAGGCSTVTHTHQATVLEIPTQGDPSSDRWTVHVQLARGEVVGSDDIALAFHQRTLMCDDGAELAPDELRVGTVVRFVREGDEVDTSNPPGVEAREIRAEC